MKISDRHLFLGGALLIAAYYLGLVWPGLYGYFTLDDTMNIYRPWSFPIRSLIAANIVFFKATPIYRPLASAWYGTIFYFAGFRPFPFHAIYTAIFLVNIWWTYSISRRLCGSREIAAVAALLISYYPAFSLLYFDVAYVFDALSYCFYFATLLLYVRIRQEDRQPTVWELTAICLLYICALNSKEIAVTLPVTLLIYESVYHPPRSSHGVLQLLWARAIVATGLVTLIFVVGRAIGSESLLAISAYRPTLTLAQFMETSRRFFGEVFGITSNSRVLAVWTGLLVIACLFRSRVLGFAWLFLMLAPLPIAFILPRGAAQYYVPWFGWVLFASVVLVRLVAYLAKRLPLERHTLARIRGGILLLVLALVLFPYYKRRGWDDVDTVKLEGPVIRDTVEQLHALYPRFPPGSRLLFKDDPFKPERWHLTFLVKESYRDDSLQVYRVKQEADPADLTQKYDHVFDYRAGRFFELSGPNATLTTPMIVSSAGVAEVYHQGFKPVTPKSPAIAGEVLIAKAIDLGPTAPPVPEGKPFPPGTLLPVSSPVEVRVDGRLTEVLDKVGWPEKVGTYRLDFVVPKPAKPGKAYVAITANRVAGPPVPILVR